jgi:hypothetical protein
MALARPGGAGDSPQDLLPLLREESSNPSRSGDEVLRADDLAFELCSFSDLREGRAMDFDVVQAHWWKHGVFARFVICRRLQLGT